MFVYADQIAEVIARHASVTKWQAVVTRDAADELTINVEGAAPPSLADELRALIRVRATVVAVAPGTIPDGAKRLDDRRSYA